MAAVGAAFQFFPPLVLALLDRMSASHCPFPQYIRVCIVLGTVKRWNSAFMAHEELTWYSVEWLPDDVGLIKKIEKLL